MHKQQQHRMHLKALGVCCLISLVGEWLQDGRGDWCRDYQVLAEHVTSHVGHAFTQHRDYLSIKAQAFLSTCSPYCQSLHGLNCKARRCTAVNWVRLQWRRRHLRQGRLTRQRQPSWWRRPRLRQFPRPRTCCTRQRRKRPHLWCVPCFLCPHTLPASCQGRTSRNSCPVLTDAGR